MEILTRFIDFNKIVHLSYYLRWIAFFLVFFVLLPGYLIWGEIKTKCNHKGYWLYQVDLSKYIDKVPVHLNAED